MRRRHRSTRAAVGAMLRLATSPERPGPWSAAHRRAGRPRLGVVGRGQRRTDGPREQPCPPLRSASEADPRRRQPRHARRSVTQPRRGPRDPGAPSRLGRPPTTQDRWWRHRHERHPDPERLVDRQVEPCVSGAPWSSWWLPGPHAPARQPLPEWRWPQCHRPERRQASRRHLPRERWPLA